MAVGFHHVSGPTLGELADRLRQAKSAAFRAKLAQNLAEEARHQVDDGFRQQRDPYGKPWAPLRRRKGQILVDTGRMRASTATEPAPDGFRLEITATYSAYHQYGTKPSQRAERGARQNARGRFVSARARTGYLLRIKAHTNPGIPQRQMVPMDSTGGLGPIWSGAFNKVTLLLLRDTFGGGA